jgi:predicted ATPase
MAQLLGIRIKNYKGLANVSLGQVTYAEGEALPALTCFIGPNGAGKSTLLDAFGFVSNCLLEGVEAACDKPARGGFDRIRTQGVSGPIEFEIFFEAGDRERPIVYLLSIDLVDGVPAVIKETLRQRQQGETRGKPYHFLKLENGSGKVWVGESVDVRAQRGDAKKVTLANRDKLGITTLGNLSEHPRIIQLRSYIEQWYLSYFIPDAAREQPPAGAQRWLNRTGSNIANVLQYLERQKGAEFASILKRLASAIPGLRRIETTTSPDKRLLIRFDEQGYVDPFYQQSMSDGTLKMLAYAILLADPEPRPFIGIEEPENGLYVRLVERLASQLSAQSISGNKAPQVLVTTHSPYFVDALQPEQVWLLRKNVEGHVTALRAADVATIRAFATEGLTLGALWYSNHLDDDGMGR